MTEGEKGYGNSGLKSFFDHQAQLFRSLTWSNPGVP